MIHLLPSFRRELPVESIECELAVVGGGLAGTCCAITAARAGLRVVLVQDRPVLGGNASSEVRMVVSGATASMGNNNRFAREGGVIDEFLLENAFRNPEGNPVIGDMILLDMVAGEPNLRLLLNTAVYDVEKLDERTIAAARGFCSQNQTLFEVRAPLFCDASGDGILGYLAGAAFRMGAESQGEFHEALAPEAASGELLGHTIYFYSKDAGSPVRFVAPRFALNDITKIKRWQRINAADQGCQYWWLEYGGRLDTIHDSEEIKWELWRIVYGVWDYIKNSGKFPEAENLTLEWVGAVPGKRESRRFEGDVILNQQDVIGRRRWPDTVSYGGWSLDLHPADGIYADRDACVQWHAKGIYSIPYRALYSRNIRNLFLAGRIISATHVAFSSTRVMATCAHNAQAAGMAAALCRRHGLLPADAASPPWIGLLQRELARTGQYIPGYRLDNPDNLARRIAVTASSRMQLRELPSDGTAVTLRESRAMLLPMAAGSVPAMTFPVRVSAPTRLLFELRAAAEPDCFTPEIVLARKTVDLPEAGDRAVRVNFDAALDRDRYVFVCVRANAEVSVFFSKWIVTGIASLAHRGRAEVSCGAVQSPPSGIGVDAFEFWRPLPPPEGRNLAMLLEPALDVFGPEQAANGIARPSSGPNAWVADPLDPAPTLTLRWEAPQRIGRIELVFDTDRDNPLYCVLFGNAPNVMPQCVRHFRIFDGRERLLYECRENHQTCATIRFPHPIETDFLQIELTAPDETTPAALFEVRCYEGD
ncbi:MAG: FAD-dependent oxidoreductase [Pirellulales bacterium]|nr:FAD-dependent oxidoreductase [Pirellulales bacterium]